MAANVPQRGTFVAEGLGGEQLDGGAVAFRVLKRGERPVKGFHSVVEDPRLPRVMPSEIADCGNSSKQRNIAKTNPAGAS